MTPVAAFVRAATAYSPSTLASVAAGSLLFIVATALDHRLNVPPWAAYALGHSAVAAFLAVRTVRPSTLQAELSELRKVKAATKMSEQLYARLEERVVAAYAARRYGGSLPPPAPPPSAP